MNYEFERVAIVNRGEAAMRFIHAARDFNQEHGTSLRTIALFNDCERHAMFVREADEAFCLGPTRVLDPTTQWTKLGFAESSRPSRPRGFSLLSGRRCSSWPPSGRTARIRTSPRRSTPPWPERAWAPGGCSLECVHDGSFGDGYGAVRPMLAVSAFLC